MTVSILYASIPLLAENISNGNLSLAEIADGFLLGLSLQDREKTQIEVYKFVRWFGPHRKATELSPVDVASYGELITPSAAKPVKTFLSYIQKKGFIELKLAPHLRTKKLSSKAIAFRQDTQVGIVLTEQGLAKLEKDLANFKGQIPAVIEEMQRAAADKDFKENAPLHAARTRKAQLEGRIKELESTLNLARLVEEGQETSKIIIGYTVVLCDLSSGKEFRYALVNPQEANPSKGKLSIASPLGKVLLDKEKGQSVEITAPAGTFCYRIENILSSSTQK